MCAVRVLGAGAKGLTQRRLHRQPAAQGTGSKGEGKGFQVGAQTRRNRATHTDSCIQTEPVASHLPLHPHTLSSSVFRSVLSACPLLCWSHRKMQCLQLTSNKMLPPPAKQCACAQVLARDVLRPAVIIFTVKRSLADRGFLPSIHFARPAQLLQGAGSDGGGGRLEVCVKTVCRSL